MPRSSRLAAVLVPPALLIGAVGAAVAATPGVVTEYPSNTGSIPSGGIGVAPSGTVYGVFNNLNTVVPFTSSGTGGQVSVAAGGNLVSSIAPGPDGAMWMTYNFTSTLGRLDTASGTTTQVGGLSSAGWSSSAGPDGRQWVTLTGGQIAAVTSSGAVTNYAVPTANPGLIGIAPGPDGRMWFTETRANKVGAISTSGQVCKEVRSP